MRKCMDIYNINLLEAFLHKSYSVRNQQKPARMPKGIRVIHLVQTNNTVAFAIKKESYRSENFSTTRTLSPRTVIGIGTTLS